MADLVTGLSRLIFATRCGLEFEQSSFKNDFGPAVSKGGGGLGVWDSRVGHVFSGNSWDKADLSKQEVAYGARRNLTDDVKE